MGFEHLVNMTPDQMREKEQEFGVRAALADLKSTYPALSLSVSTSSLDTWILWL